MKKNLLSKFAVCLKGFAILAICGAITTSCSKNDDDNTSPTPSPEPQTAKSYKVTLDMVVHQKALDMMTVDFIYTDADGKENTMKIDKNTATNGQLTEMEKLFFDNNPMLNGYKNEESHPGITDYLSSKYLNVYRVTLNNVAVGMKNWALDKEFTPAMDADKRAEELKGWKKAVNCTLGWAKD